MDITTNDPPKGRGRPKKKTLLRLWADRNSVDLESLREKLAVSASTFQRLISSTTSLSIKNALEIAKWSREHTPDDILLYEDLLKQNPAKPRPE